MNLRDIGGKKAIHIAAENNHLAAVKRLLQYGTQVSAPGLKSILASRPVSNNIKKLLQLKLETELPIEPTPEPFTFFASFKKFYRTEKSIDAAKALLEYLLNLADEEMIAQLQNLSCLQDDTLEWYHAFSPVEPCCIIL